MITPLLIELFEESFDVLLSEINQYPDDSSLWNTFNEKEIAAGNLCLHIVGNIQHYLGAVLNDSGYMRNKDAEFKIKNVSKAKLIDEVEAAKVTMRDTLEQLSKSELQKMYPVQVLSTPVSTERFLFHLLQHLQINTGQVQHHRKSHV